MIAKRQSQSDDTWNVSNCFHEKIKFIIEIEKNYFINLPNLSIYRYKLEWFTKKTWSERYLNYNSPPQMNHKKSVIIGLATIAIYLSEPLYFINIFMDKMCNKFVIMSSNPCVKPSARRAPISHWTITYLPAIHRFCRPTFWILIQWEFLIQVLDFQIKKFLTQNYTLTCTEQSLISHFSYFDQSIHKTIFLKHNSSS